MTKFFQFWFGFCIAPLYFGGGGGSATTSSNTTTQNTDKRLVASDSAIGISSDNSTINLSTTDQGAIAASFDFAKSANVLAEEKYQDLLAATGNTLSGVLGGIAAQQNFIAATTADAKGTIDNKTIMVVAGIGAVAVAALTLGGRK